ncbi:MAG TPA: NAD(P)/FAD-dependent oxidoreductase [Bryobacteraceae bacterium]|nr:NAD(P)/FAD-dependent oxidoreductase [Bryobacteraceae bacterium]
MTDQYDVIVIGAGAAGLMCAAEASKRGRRVAVLEHNAEVGRKILISGGGRCNFTNRNVTPDSFICSNPHFHKSALARYTPADFIKLVEQYRIPYHHKTLGQLFCDGSARGIVAMLLDECAKADIFTGARINEVRRADKFVVETARGAFEAQALVIACGGLSIPKIGATSLGYEIARQFGIGLAPTRPALVPLTWTPADAILWSDLAGVAINSVASFDGQSFEEKMLFTHRGLSGPAILQISSYWQPGHSIQLNLLPEVTVETVLESRGNRALKNTLSDYLPKRLAERWLDYFPLEDLHDWRCTPAGTEGYSKAEVTAGGIHPDELSSKTMEARKVPGLYFIGEVVDVTGHLGGYNFQWAWSSGWAAGQVV